MKKDGIYIIVVLVSPSSVLSFLVKYMYILISIRIQIFINSNAAGFGFHFHLDGELRDI